MGALAVGVGVYPQMGQRYQRISVSLWLRVRTSHNNAKAGKQVNKETGKQGNRVRRTKITNLQSPIAEVRRAYCSPFTVHSLLFSRESDQL